MSRDKTNRAEETIFKTRGRFLPELLSWVMSGNQEITQEVNNMIDGILLDRRRRAEVFLTALSRKYIERVVYFFGRLCLIEEELLSPKRIETMRNADLIRLFSTMAQQVDNAAEFLRVFVTDDELKSEPNPSVKSRFEPDMKDVPVTVDSVSDDERKAAQEISAESRQRIGGVLRKVLVAIDKAGGDERLRLASSASTNDDSRDEEKPRTNKPPKGRKKQ